MKLKEFKTNSKMLQHFVEKYCRMLEREGLVLDIYAHRGDENDVFKDAYGVDDHVMIYDTKSEHLLMSVWHGRGGSNNRPDHIEAGYSMNGSLAVDGKLENPMYMPTSYITKQDVDKWIKRVIRRQLKTYTKEE